MKNEDNKENCGLPKEDNILTTKKCNILIHDNSSTILLSNESDNNEVKENNNDA